MLYKVKAFSKRREIGFVEDSEIVELFLNRDQNAILQMSKKYGRKIRCMANNILHDEETSKECENDTYLGTWNLIPPNEPRDYLFAFASKIIRHLALNRCRDNKCKKRFAVYCELSEEIQECIPSGSDPEAEVDAMQLGSIIDEYLADCSAEQRNIFVRRYWFFETVSDIADRYGYSQSKVKTTLFRMREQLRKKIIKGGYNL